MAKEAKPTTGDLEAFERVLLTKAKAKAAKLARKPPTATSTASLQPAQPETEQERALRVFRLANESKPLPPDDLKFLRELLDRGKGQPINGGIAQHAINAAIDKSHATTLSKEVFRRNLETIRSDLGYDTSPEIERLLIDQICMCTLRLWMAEHRHSRELDREGVTFTQAEYNERVLTASHRRYDTAIETLARVRKLKLPPVQVNIAQAGAKQTNIAASAAKGEPGT